MDKIFCLNCGASIDVTEPKCPFCGYINIPGAEEKFMQDLEQTQEDLSQIPKMQEEQIKKSFFKSSKVIWITILIVALVLIFFVGGSFACTKVLDSIFLTEYDTKAEMLWERENYPILDEMYEKGDYDGILAFQDELYEINYKDNTNHGLYNWKHISFIDYYRAYKLTQETVKCLDEGDEISEYLVHDLVYNCMRYHYRAYLEEYSTVTPQEEQLLEEYREYMEEVFYNRLKFTDEEADALYEKAVDYGVISAKKCYDYADKIKKRIE